MNKKKTNKTKQNKKTKPKKNNNPKQTNKQTNKKKTPKKPPKQPKPYHTENFAVVVRSELNSQPTNKETGDLTGHTFLVPRK